jgi:hypothetical protein
MNFALLNVSAAADDDFKRMADAFRIGLGMFCGDRELASGDVQFIAKGQNIPDGWYALLATNDPDPGVDGVEGWHDVDADGKPFGKGCLNCVPNRRVLYDPTGRGESLATVLFHEMIEMRADPLADSYHHVLFVDTATGARYGEVAEEPGDPVQAVSMAIEIGGVKVDLSNWIVDNWYNPKATRGFDHLGVLTQPLTIYRGGYVICAMQPSDDLDVFGRRVVKVEHHVVPVADWRKKMRALSSRFHLRQRSA